MAHCSNALIDHDSDVTSEYNNDEQVFTPEHEKDVPEAGIENPPKIIKCSGVHHEYFSPALLLP